MISVDKETFKTEVTEAKALVLVDFYGDTCEPCQALMPEIVALSEQYGNQVKFVKLNISGARRLAIAEKVLGLPTITMYKDGQKLAELTKYDATKVNIEEMIQKAIS